MLSPESVLVAFAGRRWFWAELSSFPIIRSWSGVTRSTEVCRVIACLNMPQSFPHSVSKITCHLKWIFFPFGKGGEYGLLCQKTACSALGLRWPMSPTRVLKSCWWEKGVWSLEGGMYVIRQNTSLTSPRSPFSLFTDCTFYRVLRSWESLFTAWHLQRRGVTWEADLSLHFSEHLLSFWKRVKMQLCVCWQQLARNSNLI